jgi:SpoVK/Ycf46/Vps4 family AAA+-type ATPase
VTTSERLAPLAVAARDGDPFLIVYGPGTDDAFIDTGHRVCTIEQALWEVLHAAGFGRIGFHSLGRTLYFRDDESLRAARAGAGAPAPARAQRQMRAGFSGPLGGRIVEEFGPPAAATAQAPPPAGRGMSDARSVQMFSHLMTHPTLRTALVFMNAAETLRYIETDRGLARFFAQQSQWGPGAPHTCVLVFREPSLSAVTEYLAALNGPRAVTTSAARLNRREDQPGLVGYPDDAELARLIGLLRLTGGLRIGDWRALPAMTRAMSAEPVTTRTWQWRLQALAADGMPLDAAQLRQRGWIRSPVPGPGGVRAALGGMRGIGRVKEHLEALQWRIRAETRLHAEGRSAGAEPGSHHLVFTGNPGTGKTTVARLVGEMYRDLGVLRKGQVVEASVGDLVGQFVGSTAPRTNELIDRALDGVLFIDEAYQLSDQQSGFGQEAIDTLLARMENDRRRLVVIVAGYQDKMTEFLDANLGLRGRFPQANVLEFGDYDPATLTGILSDRLAALGVTCTAELRARLEAVVAGMYRTRKQGFSNARAMRELADEIMTQWAQRTCGEIAEPADVADVPARLEAHALTGLPDMAELLGEIDAMVGLQSVKEAIHKLVNQLRLKQRRGRGQVVAPHLLFLGPPGTGKTTVARLMGQIFRSLGLLADGHVVEVGRRDLVGAFIGETAIKTSKRITEAFDGVLFIDEAYSLARGDDRDFGTEAIETLIQDMENHRGRLAVIAAGYSDRMAGFLAANPGLESRFTHRVDFPDYSGAELLDILRGMAAEEDYVLAPGALERAGSWLAARRAAQPGAFGNGRAVRKLLAEMEARLGARLAADPDADVSIFEAADVPDAGF